MKFKQFLTAAAAVSLIAAPTMASAQSVPAPATEEVSGDQLAGGGFLVAIIAAAAIIAGIIIIADDDDSPNSP